MNEWIFVIGVTLFEFSFAQTDGLPNRAVWFGCCHSCFINYFLSQAFPLHWTCRFLSDPVAGFFLLLVYCWFQDFPVVGADDWLSIRHTAVTHFYRIFIENFVKLWVFGEVFLNEVDEVFTDVRGDGFIKRWIEPNYFPFPLFFWLVVVTSWVVTERMLISWPLKCFFCIMVLLLWISLRLQRGLKGVSRWPQGLVWWCSGDD